MSERHEGIYVVIVLALLVGGILSGLANHHGLSVFCGLVFFLTVLEYHIIKFYVLYKRKQPPAEEKEE